MTDSKLVAGHFPGVEKYPLVLGHESTGIVEAVGSKVRNFHHGARVIGGRLFEFSDARYASGWGGFCEYTLVNDHDALAADAMADADHGWRECYEIQRTVAADIPAEEAVLLCTWREVLGGFEDFQLRTGDDILIFGAGAVGLSFVKLARLLGLGWVGVVDPLPEKRRRALVMGADQAFLPDEPALSQRKVGRGKPLDAVIDAVGNPACIDLGLPLIRMGGSVCIYGVISAAELIIHKGAAPYNFNLLVHQWPTRWRERKAQQPLSEWIRQGKLRAAEFVTHEFPVAQIGEALDAVRSGEVIKCLLRF
jgi:threonine dehydrogenase-like Zn-dependent dehydrogenase